MGDVLKYHVILCLDDSYNFINERWPVQTLTP